MVEYIIRSMGDPVDCFVEECAEAIKEAMKCKRFPPGHSTYEKWVAAGNRPPRNLLVQEIGDVLAAIDVLVNRGLMTDMELRTAKYGKLQKMAEQFGHGAVFGPLYAKPTDPEYDGVRMLNGIDLHTGEPALNITTEPDGKLRVYDGAKPEDQV